MSFINIPLGDGFKIGLGDANRDGKIDFDFGLRSQSWGASPWGVSTGGAEIGFNTARGVYAGGDYSNSNMWGSSGGGARVFSDGGYESGHWANDVFGNYQGSHQAAGPGYYRGATAGGNVWNGNYHGSNVNVDPFSASSNQWAGNSWTGAHVGTGQYADVFGGRNAYATATPPFVPNYGAGYYNSCGCGCAGNFLFR